MEPLLRVSDVSKRFKVRGGHVSAVDDVSFYVQAGDTVGIVGESGSGKSTLARLVLRLIEPDTGEVVFDGKNVAEARGAGLKELRRGMQMVFQDPYSSVNPRMPIGGNIGFPMKVQGFGKREIRDRTADLLDQVGLHPNHASYYPHQLSGGQLQRVNIARALTMEPKLVVCDEPLSALDKSIQAQVLNLLRDLRERLGLTYLFISHDLNVVEYFSDHVLVVYLGHVVESCPAKDLYREPLHPYTKVLLSAIPSVDPDTRTEAQALGGEPPSPLDPPSGCRFRTRCPLAMDICAREKPALREAATGHSVACHLFEERV
ncbi:peptide/nickel transport system ATP-binding protein/oligopeptide transport system ATP-binding protein [Actinocrispum wychmicini]|uniref:Peptide/nickel transport system ATP-binding protein/oligopeptide transport system ATP-binding protein n=2 Tax=Actinocrispum wychmicini TaxID=1213861 RepID=A0A4R2JL09_9PSEU|nr:peptide/nickel transport system ATP-binding protein/oligopeptide transport system ATP-binding protein [Actinocrispum wychmicini]